MGEIPIYETGNIKYYGLRAGKKFFQGIGGKFISAIEEYLKKHDMKAIFLLTENDVPAYDFYKNHGFKELKNTVAFVKWLS